MKNSVYQKEDELPLVGTTEDIKNPEPSSTPIDLNALVIGREHAIVPDENGKIRIVNQE